MQITFLKKMKNNPTYNGFINEGLSLTDIQQLELTFNNGNPFPKVLKEFLYLAGGYCCYVQFNGTSGINSIIENHNQLNEDLEEFYDVVIDRPHFYLETENIDYAVFMFLDEGDNPVINYMLQEVDPTPSHYYERACTFPEFIDARIQNVLDGYPLF